MTIPHHPGASIVFADVDNVLYDGNLALDVAKKVAKGFKAIKAVASVGAAVVRYRAGKATIQDILTAATGLFAGEKRSDLAPKVQAAVREHCLGNLRSEVVAALERYTAAGVPVVLFSTAPQDAVAEVASRLKGPGDRIAAGAEVQVDAEGRLTREPVEPLPYGEGKVTLAERIASERGADLAGAVYLGDSRSDVALLERVGHPICINGGKEVVATAEARGWPIVTAR